MKCVALYNSCDKERFENILKWNALSYCEFWGDRPKFCVNLQSKV